MNFSPLNFCVLLTVFTLPSSGYARCLCPSGWLAYGRNCYLYVRQPESFDSAEASCIARGQIGRPAHLASVLDSEEGAFLSEVVAEQAGPAGFAWIGLSDSSTEGTWTWHDGTPFSYSNWGSGQPDNSGNEDCTALRDDAYWNDYICHYGVPYICKMLQRYRTHP